MSTRITTPTGRIVWGHPLREQVVKDLQTGKPRLNEDGEKRTQWTFGLAIPKDDFEPVREAMAEAAKEEFPKGVPDGFAWKFKNGDKMDREGCAGCFVLALSTELQPPTNYTYDHGEEKWIETDEIKRGDFVQVEIDIVAHDAISKVAKAGLYLNPLTVALQRVGKEIKGAGGGSDPNKSDAFATPPPQEAPAESAPKSKKEDGDDPRHDEFFEGPKADDD